MDTNKYRDLQAAPTHRPPITAINVRSAVRLLQQGVVDFNVSPGVSDLEAYKLAVVRQAVRCTRNRPCR